MSIYVTDMRHVKDHPEGRAFAIVRSMKNPIPGVGQLSDLSPERGLFTTYLSLRDRGAWGPKAFREIYVPQFLADLDANPNTVLWLNRLYRADKAGDVITLACFCADESLCHRSIVAGLLQGVGADVRTATGADYTEYYDRLVNIRKARMGR